MRGKGPASPLGAPLAPRCLIRALAGVSLEPQDFLSCRGKEREVRAGSLGGPEPGRERVEGQGEWSGRRKVRRRWEGRQEVRGVDRELRTGSQGLGPENAGGEVGESRRG